jgi:alkanesulfonate monooxygenase
VADVARWSEDFGCTGMLIYTDNSIVDPWLISQIVLENTQSLAPLVAVQPIYMHPYSVAKMVASFASIYQRRIYLNMLAGGFKNDLVALGDDTPHDDRYVRTIEFSKIVKHLTFSDDPVNFAGNYYNVKNLRMTPAVEPKLAPGILISGSSEAGINAAQEIGATAVKYPKPPGEEPGVPEDFPVECGVRVGIIARPTHEEAWCVAHERFPHDRKGEITHKIAMKVSDSEWHKQLSIRQDAQDEDSPYWLVPFQHYKTFCPYLVGDYQTVAHELRDYITKRYRTFILDIPPDQNELEHTSQAFSIALRK